MSDIFSNLSPQLADTLRKAVAEREASGLNVHFINERGEKDRYSFADAASRDKFIASLKRAGRVIL
jgi:hypothetical protein